MSKLIFIISVFILISCGDSDVNDVNTQIYGKWVLKRLSGGIEGRVYFINPAT